MIDAGQTDDGGRRPGGSPQLEPIDIVERFFAIEAARVTPRTVRTYSQVVARLDDYLHTVDATPWIGPHYAALLQAERQFAPKGAVLRLFGLEGLVFCLPGFLEPEWLSPVPSERRAQIALTGRLLDHLRRRDLIDFREIACAFYEARQAVHDARDAA
ncbi:MAG: hypothetical protein P1U38_01210 [Aeromicrobium sp.]|uniref:hypothetical protein n=1 Tax=Aeromicrobium sp. TaxID=1871063 RepID=UPI00262E5107|nr:hypothetical protein [Aeromicrobium sp.]MDF1703372.1 hypothetical protein [Aeromicrobium sp.]